MPDEGWGRVGAPRVVTLEQCLAWGGEQRQRCRVVLAVSGIFQKEGRGVVGGHYRQGMIKGVVGLTTPVWQFGYQALCNRT